MGVSRGGAEQQMWAAGGGCRPHGWHGTHITGAGLRAATHSHTHVAGCALLAGCSIARASQQAASCWQRHVPAAPRLRVRACGQALT